MNADPTKIMQAAKGVDFSKAITPEALTNAAKGDPSALAQVVNEAAQAGFAQSSVATAKIVEAALARQAQDFQDKYIPEVLRRERINNALTADNPLFSNPAVAPMMEMLKSQMATKYPTASAAEVKAKAEEYMTGFASEIAKATGKSFGDAAAGGAGGAGGSGASQEEDWSKFFGLS
jgi:hypothetical protein